MDFWPLAATSPDPAALEKVFLSDIEGVVSGGVARKMELVGLMRLADPDDLDQDLFLSACP